MLLARRTAGGLEARKEGGMRVKAVEGSLPEKLGRARAVKVILALGLGQPRSAPKGLSRRGYLAGAFGNGDGMGRPMRPEVTGVARIL